MRQFDYPNGKPALKDLKNDSNLARLFEDFIVVETKTNKRYITPKGYVTDGASYPEATEPIMGDPFAGVTKPAAVIHDWLCDVAAYAHKQRQSKNSKLIVEYLNSGGEIVSQKETHKLFYKLFCFEIKHNREYGWFWRYPWNNKTWHYSRAWIAYKMVVIYNRIKNPKWK